MKKRIRAGVALLLSLMLLVQLCDGVIALAVEDPTANIVLTTPDDLKDGSWFFIAQTEWSVSEKSADKLYIPIQRTGDLEKEASVELKLVDVTAHPGENYTASVYKDDPETETVLDGEALVDIIADPDEQVEVDKDEYAQASRELLDQGGVLTDAGDTPVGGIQSAEGRKAEEDPAPAEDDPAPAKEEQAPAEDPAPAKEDQAPAEDPAPAKDGQSPAKEDPDRLTVQSADGQTADLLAYPTNPLRQARNTYAGSASDRQDMVGDRSWINHSSAESYSGSDAPLVTEDYPGTVYKLTFAPGQAVKFLVIDPKYSDKAQGDASLMLLLGTPSDGYLVPEFCTVTSVTIVDEDPPEEVVVSFRDTTVYARDGKARLTVTRTGRTNDLVTVLVSTQEGSGVTGQDFSGVGAKLYFSMGMNTRTIEIPVNHDTREKDFYVTITPVSDCTIGSGRAHVIIPPAEDNASLQGEDYLGIPLDEEMFTSTMVNTVSHGDAGASYGRGGLRTNSGNASAIMMIRLNPRQTSAQPLQNFTYFYDGVMVDWEQETGWFSSGDDHLFLSTDLSPYYWASYYMTDNHMDRPATNTEGTVYGTRIAETEEFSRRDYLFFWDTSITEQTLFSGGYKNGMNPRTVNIINNTNRNWRETKVNSVRLIQRNFHFDLLPAQTLGMRGVSQADEAAMQSVKLNSSMTATSVDVLSGGSFAVTAANQKNLRFKAVEAVREINGQEVAWTIAEVPKGASTVVIDVTMDLVDDLCYKGLCSLQPNNKIQNKLDVYPDIYVEDDGVFVGGKSYQGVTKIRPVFEKVPVTVDVQPGTYGSFRGLETGEQTWYMGERLTLTTELNERGRTAGVEPTGVAVERRWSKSGEYIAKFDDYYLDETLTSSYQVDSPYMRVQPTFTSVGNTVSVKLSAADRELFDLTKGLFAGQTPVYSADTDTYTYTLADKVKISQLVDLMAVPKDLSMVPLWTTSRDRTVYSGYSFVLRAGATAEENALTLSLSRSGNEFYALSGTLCADELNLNTGALTGVLSPAAEAMVSAGASGVYAGADGTFTVPAQRFAPGTTARWSVSYNGGTEIQESALPAAGAPTAPAQGADGAQVQAVMLDVGMKKVPTWSGLNAHFIGSYVTQSGVYVIGTSILELNGSKTILSAAADPGVGYLDRNGNQRTENVTAVTFSFRDPRTGRTRAEVPAKYDGVSRTWQADLGRFAPEDMEGTCTYGDLVYVQMTTDRDPDGSGGSTLYAPVNTGYAVISSNEVSQATTFEMDLPFDQLIDSFTGGANLSGDASHTTADIKSLPFLGEIKTFIGVAKQSTRAWKAIAARGQNETAQMIAEDLTNMADDASLEGDPGKPGAGDSVLGGGFAVNLLIDFRELPYGGTRVLLGALISVGNASYQRMTNPYGNLTTVLSGSAADKGGGDVDPNYNSMQQIGDDGTVRIQDDAAPQGMIGTPSAIAKSNKNWMGGPYFAFGIYAGVYMDFGLLTRTVTVADGSRNVTTEFTQLGAGGFTGVMGKAGGLFPCTVFPIYFGLEGSADVKAFFGQTGDPYVTLADFKDGKDISASEWTFNMDSDIRVKGMGYVGLGIPGLLGVKASVGVQLRFTNSNKLPKWFPNNPDMAEGKGMGTDAIFEGTIDLVFISLPLFTYSYPMPLEGGSVPYFREISKARKVIDILTPRLEASALSSSQKEEFRRDIQTLDDVIHDTSHASHLEIADASMKVWDKAERLGLLTEEEHHVFYTFRFEGRAGGIIGSLLGDETGKAQHDYFVPDYDASRWVANDGASLSASFRQAESKTILEDTVNQPEPQLLDLGGGEVLLAFLDADPERPAGQQSVLKLAVLDTETGRWSAPETVQADGTGDFAPNLCDCGEEGILLTWVSTAPEKVKTEDDPLDTLAQLDVFSVMLDRSGRVAGQIEQLTDDTVRDYNPQGIYDPSTGDRMVLYIKTAPDTDYQAESDAQKFFDYANPYAGDKMYSVMAYMLYNNQPEAQDNTGRTHAPGWARTYYFANEMQTIPEDFLEQWGGQRFLISPILDENGDEDQQDPVIADLTTCIAENGMASFAYSVDMDWDSGTWDDKELFVQFYDFQEHSVYVPVRLSDDNQCQSCPQLVRSGGETRLFFLNDMDTLFYMNVTQMLNAQVPRSETDPTMIYALQDDGTFAGGYTPAYHPVEAAGSEYGELGRVTGYTAYVDGDDNLYVVYPAAVQYTDEFGEKRSAQEIFAIGFIQEDYAEGERGGTCWSKPAQLTTGHRNNAEPAVTTDSSGSLILVHNQYEMIDRSDDEEWLEANAAVVVETDARGNQVETVKAPYCEVTPTDLVLTRCAPVGSLACTRVTYSDETPEPGDEITVTALLENTGLTSVRRGHVDVYEYADGVKGQRINGGTYDVEEIMLPNGSAGYDFQWQVPDTAEQLEKTSLLFEITEYDQNGRQYDTLRFVNGSFILRADLSARVDSLEQQGDVYHVTYSVTNDGNLPAEPMYVRLALQGLYGSLETDYGVADPELCGDDLDTLAPGQTKSYSQTVTVPASVFDKCGYDAVAPELTVPEDHEGVFLSGDAMYITQEEPFHVQINGGKPISLTVGKTADLALTYDLNAVADQGTTAVWTVSDPSVATVRDGKLVALGSGSAILTATLLPYGTNASVAVHVGGGGSGGGGGGGGGGTAAPAYPVVAPATTTHGKVTLSAASAKAGETVTVTLTPDQGYEAAGVTVTDGDGNSVPVTKNDDGTYRFTMPAGAVNVSPAFVKEGERPDSASCPRDASCPISPFTDAKPSAWYHDGVHWALDEGIMKGTGETTFQPSGSATRAMVVTMLWRLAGEPAGSEPAPFTDVTQGSWYADGVNWAAENGVVSGTSATAFSPNTPVTREQLAAILYRYAQDQGKGFTGAWAFPLDYPDAEKVSSYAREAMCWMTMKGVITGMGDGTLAPRDNATRAQIATMFMRFTDVMAQ